MFIPGTDIIKELQTKVIDCMKSELPKGLYYHSVDHTVDVINSAYQLAKEEDIDIESETLLIIAAIFHDFGFTISMLEHEKHSCMLAEQYLSKCKLSTEQIEQITQAIMATKIPQTPTNRIGELLCDADLDYLGRDDFFEIGNRLFDEINATIRPMNRKEWNTVQINFLESHQYFTSTNQKRREESKKKHLNSLRKLFNEYNMPE